MRSTALPADLALATRPPPASLPRHREQSEAIQTKPAPQTLSLDRFALLAMTAGMKRNTSYVCLTDTVPGRAL